MNYLFFKGGFIGVDIFFVISGFLITNIILNKLYENNFSFYDFYERRARRLLPVLYFIIIFSIPLAYILVTPSSFDSFGKSISTILIFCSNILFWSEDPYFSSGAIYKPFLHTWSLAVEEQYYMVFPILLCTIFKYFKKNILLILLLLFISSFLIGIYLSNNRPDLAFFALPSRFWEILMGSFLAIFSINNPKIVNSLKYNSLSYLGLLGIVISMYAFNSETPWPSYNALLPTISTAILIIFISKSTLLFRILSWKPLVVIGLISYSLYLWHYPLLSFLKILFGRSSSF